MKSFFSIQILCLLLLSSFNGVIVDARIGSNNNKNKNAAIPQKPAIKIGSEQQRQQQHQEQQHDDEQHERSLLSNVVENLKSELPSLIESIHHASFNTHRSFGGGPTSSSSRSLEQAWARDNNGDILWWIWLIIALGIALCFCLCCCTSVCCLRD